MATRVGQCMASDPGGAATNGYTATYSASVAAGHAVVLALVSGGGAGAPTNSPFQDSAGNAFTLAASGTQSGGAWNTYLYICRNVAAITGGVTTLLVSFSGLTNTVITADDFNTADGVIDQSAVAAPNAATSVSVGPSGSIAQAAEFVVAAFGGLIAGASPPGFTAGGSYTAGGARTESLGGANTVYCYTEYLILTAGSGTQTATATLGSAPATDSAVLGTFKDTDPFPVGYQQEFPHSQRGRSALLRMHHRESDADRFRHRRPSGLWLAR